jgi:hypothetical protein
MRTIKKNVYYCDFCKKKSLRSLKQHEEHCTANPNRTCGVCGTTSIFYAIQHFKKLFKDIPQKIDKVGRGNINEFGYDENDIDRYKEMIKSHKNEIEHFTECPACFLSIIRNSVPKEMNFCLSAFDFNYKDELARWWEEKNNEEPYY